MRLTEFWDRMNAQFGDAYAQSVAKDFVFGQLDGRIDATADLTHQSARVRRLEAGGGTNIPSGLSLGLRTLSEAEQGRVRRVVLEIPA